MIPGICHICGRPATRTCPACGKPVCEHCVDQGSGICLACSLRKNNDIPGSRDRGEKRIFN